MEARPTIDQYDPSHELFLPRRLHLDAIFHPRSVAVIGATERPGSVGRTLLWNLISNPFGGTVYPVNPKRTNVLGIRAYPSVKEIPDLVDLAVIATPAPTVPEVVQACVEAGVKGAVIVSAGFREIGESGQQLEEQILAIARKGGMRLIGPNCLGVMRPVTGLNATFASTMARPGTVGFISQSGALLTSILDWSLEENVGFSAFISVGSMLDVGWGDLIYYLGSDPYTKSIILYMESIGDARSFLSAAREVALQKPIIVIKAGRTEAAAKAALSHTGSLAGSDEVLSAAFRRTGVLRVDRIADLFYMAEVLAKQPRPEGPRLTILTNAGGAGVLATDALVQGGGQLAELSAETKKRLDAFLPPHWSRSNPVDILGDADPERYAKVLEVTLADENSDGLLVILTPQAMTDPTQTAEQLRRFAQSRKPILTSWMGGVEVAAGRKILNRAGIPIFQYPDTAVRVFNYMWRYTYNLRALYETPSLSDDEIDGGPHREQAQQIIEQVQREGRTLLTEYEAKQILEAYCLPVTPTRLAQTADEAVAAAEELGYPVVLKLHSFKITHKTDVGGVQLNLHAPDEVRRAFETIRSNLEKRGQADAFAGVTVQPMVRVQEGYELIIGSTIDSQFGPVLLFGAGGTLVEVYRDRALGLPPLNTTLARRMMEQTKIYQALQGVRGRSPVQLDRLEKLMVRFSQLVVEQPRIREIDINPLLAAADQIVALDARIVLHPPEMREEALPRPAIRPYPRQYMGTWRLTDGTPVLIRPIRPEDEPLLVAFHYKLSERSVYLRYASLLKVSQRVAHERLARLCFIDYDREMALVAERRSPETDCPEILAVARLTKIYGTNDGEFAMLVRDDVQGKGLGTELLRRLIQIGEVEGLERIVADILVQNHAMQHVCRKLGFKILRGDDPADPMVKAVKVLRVPAERETFAKA